MKILYKISVVAFMVISVAALQSCTKDDTSSVSTPGLKSQGGNVFYGPTIPIGNGVARAWVQENSNGEPMAVGIDLSDKALQGLGEEPTAWVLLFPKNKGKNFYKHMLVDWNPQGHEPPGVYDLPHFDFHFYTITSEERMQIGPAGAPGFDILPASQYVPPAYVRFRVAFRKWEHTGLMCLRRNLTGVYSLKLSSWDHGMALLSSMNR